MSGAILNDGQNGGLIKQTPFEEFITTRQQKKEIIDVFQKERRERKDVRVNLGRSIVSVYEFLKQFGIRNGEISFDEYIVAEKELKKRALSAVKEKKKIREESRIFSRFFLPLNKKSQDADPWECYISHGFFQAGRFPFSVSWYSTAFSMYASGLTSPYVHFHGGNYFLRWIAELEDWKCLPANALNLVHQLFAQCHVKTDPKLGLLEDLLYVFNVDTRAKDPTDDDVFISEIQHVNSILEKMQDSLSPRTVSSSLSS